MNQQNSNIVILLTATITPNGMLNTALQDSAIREKQYIDAIEYYLNETDLRIVFCENTKKNIFYKINSEQKTARLEYITFDGNNYDRNLGKGYGESQIIKKAISCSDFLKKAQWVIKITGRVKILNIKDIIFDVYRIGNANDNILGAELYRKDWVHSVCFYSDKNWLFKTICYYESQIREYDFYFERMLYQGVLSARNIEVRPIFPIIEGISGTFNTKYKIDSLYQRKVDHYNTLSILSKENDEPIYKLIRNRFLWYYNRLMLKIESQRYLE